MVFYAKKPLTEREWSNISLGGKSDEIQRKADYRAWYGKLSRGELSLLLTGTTPIILNKNEKFQFSIPQVQMLEHVVKTVRTYHKLLLLRRGTIQHKKNQ